MGDGVEVAWGERDDDDVVRRKQRYDATLDKEI